MSPRWHLELNSWLIHHQSRDSTTWAIVLTSIKGIQSLSLWNDMVFYYMGSQSTFIFRIEYTQFTHCLCKKLILGHYRYILYLILNSSYGCFFEGIWWFNRWHVCSLFHNAFYLWVTRNIIRREVKVKKIGFQIKVKGLAMGPREGNGLSHAGQGLAEVQILIVVVAILTD